MQARIEERSDPTLAALRSRLARARTRARSALLLRGALRSLIVGAGVYLVLALVAPLTDALPLGATPWGAGALALAIGLVASVPWALAVTPSLLELARRADRRFDLAERASTALEHAPGAGGVGSEIGAALAHDAARHAARIDPRELVRLRPPRELVPALVLVAAVGALPLLSPLVATRTGVGGQIAPSAPLDVEEAAVAATDLRRTAELLVGEAEDRSDPYLEAVAQAMNDLADRFEQGGLDREEAQAELDRLLEHAGRALGSDVQAPSAAAALEDGAEILEMSLPNAENGANGDPVEGTGALDSNGLDDLLAALEEAKQEREDRERQLAQTPYGDGFGDLAPRNTRSPQTQISELAAGEIVGPALESQRGEGLAGQGTQPLEGEPEAGALEEGGEVAPMLLPDAADDGGEQVRVEAEPETQLSEVDATGAAPAVASSVGREAELRRDLLAPRNRLVAGRYFDDTTPGSETGPDGETDAQPGAER